MGKTVFAGEGAIDRLPYMSEHFKTNKEPEQELAKNPLKKKQQRTKQIQLLTMGKINSCLEKEM